MEEKRCFLIGHRDAENEIFPRLLKEIKRHITEYGVREFIVGCYGNFDRLAAKAVIDAKTVYPEIKLTLLLPYHPESRPPKYSEGYDGTCYPPGMEQVPPRYAIVKANQYTVDHADHLVAYVWHPASNARKLVAYARKREQKGLLTVTLLSKEF